MTDLLSRLKAELINRYEIERELGKGGAATVYLARDLKHDRQVALKVLSPEVSGAIGSERFLREIQTAARLQHPHILPLHDSGEADGLLYYVMPYVEGESLRERLNREKQLPLEAAVRIAEEVADALAYAHQQDVIHRDIKPENILLSGGHASVADFGIARALRSAGAETQTATGVSVGTPAYMSPEQASASGAIDGRSDIYSLGCVLYEMLAGQGPFTGATTESLVRQHISEEPPAITKQRPAVPQHIALALERALAKTPADRFSSAAELGEAIKLPTTTTTTVAASSATSGSKLRVGMAAVAIALVAVIAIVMGRSRGPTDLPETPGVPALPNVGDKVMIAVLPFENLGSPEDEYFADGITEEITSHLAVVQDLGVIARTSANQYKGTEKDIDQIGGELGVDYILEGTVRWQKTTDGQSRIRVTPQLIKVTDATHLWADRYDAVMDDVFEVQTSIAEKVVQSLNVALLEPEETALAVKPTADLEAYDFYLRGRDYIRNRSYFGDDNLIAADMFKKAVELDPYFALAWAELAIAHVDAYWFYQDYTPERLDLAKKAAERALEIDPDLPRAHFSMGQYHYHGNLDYENAIKEFEIAAAGMPNDSDIQVGLGAVKRRQGRWEEALVHMQEASRLDPRSAGKANELGMTYGWLGEHGQAMRNFDRAISISPDLPDPYLFKANQMLIGAGDVEGCKQAVETSINVVGLVPTALGLINTGSAEVIRMLDKNTLLRISEMSLPALGSDTTGYYFLKREALFALERPDEAVELLKKELAYYEQHPPVAGPYEGFDYCNRAYVLAYLGDEKKALADIKKAGEILPTSKDEFNGAIILAIQAGLYLELEEYELALDAMERFLALNRWWSAAYLRNSRTWDPLRDHPRFQRLLNEAA